MELSTVKVGKDTIKVRVWGGSYELLSQVYESEEVEEKLQLFEDLVRTAIDVFPGDLTEKYEAFVNAYDKLIKSQ